MTYQEVKPLLTIAGVIFTIIGLIGLRSVLFLSDISFSKTIIGLISSFLVIMGLSILLTTINS